MIKNLDDLTVEDLEEFLAKAQQDKKKLAEEVFGGEKPPAFMRAINMMVKYAEARLDMLDQFAKGRKEKADRIRVKLDSIYRTIPEYAQWL